jgi:hypothetical protein
LRANGCEWNEETCQYAVEAEYPESLEVLQWARANGCPWDYRTCRDAQGEPELLQWAQANGCPWDEDVCHEQERMCGCGRNMWPWDEACRVCCAREGEPEPDTALGDILNALRQLVTASHIDASARDTTNATWNAIIEFDAASDVDIRGDVPTEAEQEGEQEFVVVD